MRILGLPNTSCSAIIRFAQQNDLSFKYIDQEDLDRMKLRKSNEQQTRNDYDIVFFPTVSAWKDNQFKIHNSSVRAKCVIINDYINKMQLVERIQIFDNLQDIEPELAFYIKNKLCFDYLRIRVKKDTYLYDILENYQESIFQREIQPILYKGITNKACREEIRKAIVYDIFSVLKRDFAPTVVAYKSYIKDNFYTQFTQWLQSTEAKTFCKELLVKKKDGLLDAFEVSYLYSVLSKKV